MPTKRNKGGEMQPYIPAGNGDASGEYANNKGSDGSFGSGENTSKTTSKQQAPKKDYEKDFEDLKKKHFYSEYYDSGFKEYDNKDFQYWNDYNDLKDKVRNAIRNGEQLDENEINKIKENIEEDYYDFFYRDFRWDNTEFEELYDMYKKINNISDNKFEKGLEKGFKQGLNRE